MASTSKYRLITNSYQKRKGPGVHGESSGSGKANVIDDSVKRTSKTGFEKDLEILREFDLTWEYGPSMGITRLERWKRAEKHGLNPSQKVRQLIEDHKHDDHYTQCLWNDYKNIM